MGRGGPATCTATSENATLGGVLMVGYGERGAVGAGVVGRGDQPVSGEQEREGKSKEHVVPTVSTRAGECGCQ